MSHLRDIPKISSLINTEFDGKDFDQIISSDKMEGQVNTYILNRLEFYELTEYCDDLLYQEFSTDFEGWTVELFNKADRNLCGALKSHLNDHGLYIAKASKNETVSDQFFNLFTNADYEWPEGEAETYKKSRPHKYMSVRHNPDAFKIFISTSQNKISADQIQQNACHGSGHLDVPTNPSSEILKSDPTSILNDDKRSARASTSRWDENSAKMTTTFDKNDANNDNRSDTFQQGATFAKALTDLGKLYSDSDNKFGGERYDVLDTKLKIFKELCQKAGIPQTMYHKAFSTMLKGCAQTLYYDHITEGNLNFNQMVKMMQNYFHPPENRQMYLTEWRTTTLKQIIRQNPDKTLPEQLEILIDKLQKVYRGLSADSRRHYELAEQPVNAVNGVAACSQIIIKPSSTFETIASELRSSVGSYLRYNNDLTTTQCNNGPLSFESDDENVGINQYWVDRRY
ncbi:integrase and RNaseH domain-containing protein [Golovinomyces cichoracearum]|uniref:Integrase and RNaseH domain-containing protein n=1 Tax=Golovinomyces cichoracearum TaxID=62708 RepID=A0A420HB34_9PEZI|nr:integrase and RNaseH domain-containing protein [Golovinomyces cichoracearum]